MNSDLVATALVKELDKMGLLARELDAAANTTFASSSMLSLDNAAAVTEDHTQAVASYITNRAQNAARFAREVHTATTQRNPGKLHLDYTVLYPLLRGALEDAGAIVWLLAPTDQQTRLTRALRLLRHDANYLVSNQRLLALTASGVREVPDELSVQAAELMEREKVKLDAHYEDVAEELSIDPAEVRRAVRTSDPLRDAYGETSMPFVMWKLLSDLSHYSYTMTRHLSESIVLGTQLSNVTLQIFIDEVNRVLETGLTLLRCAVQEATS